MADRIDGLMEPIYPGALRCRLCGAVFHFRPRSRKAISDHNRQHLQKIDATGGVVSPPMRIIRTMMHGGRFFSPRSALDGHEPSVSNEPDGTCPVVNSSNPSNGSL